MVPNLLFGGFVGGGCVVLVEDSELLEFTCVSCAEAKANHTAMCMSSRPLKLLWTVICEHFKVYFCIHSYLKHQYIIFIWSMFHALI
jgi:hypothetical protein